MNLEGICLNIQKDFLCEKLLGARVDKVFQPGKTILILQLRTNKENIFLQINVANTAPHIRLLLKNTINPEMPSAFCMLLRKQLENGRITNIMQQNLDRVFIFEISTIGMAANIVSKKLIVELTGKNSNIILVQDDTIIDCIKHIGAKVNKLRQMLPQRPYFPPPAQHGINILSSNSKEICASISNLPLPLTKAIVAITVGIGPFTAKEISFRAGLPFNIPSNTLDMHDLSALEEAINSISQPIKEKAVQMYLSLDQTNKILALTPYKPDHLGKIIFKTFPDINQAIEHAVNLEVSTPPESIQLAKSLKNEISRLQRKTILLQEEYQTAINAEYFKNIADNIMAHLNSLQENRTKFYCNDFITGEKMIIELQENLTLIENAQRYYKLYNKTKRAVKWLDAQLKENEVLLEYMESIEFSLQNIQTKDELNEIKNELKSLGLLYEKTRKPVKIQQSVPLKIELKTGAHVLIGKNNKQNDTLTFKTAKPDDIWLHTKNIPGSHVILQTAGKPATHEEILLAANLAAWFSKARSSSSIPVDYTLRRHVKKPSGSKPGFVIYENQKTLQITTNENTIVDLLKN